MAEYLTLGNLPSTLSRSEYSGTLRNYERVLLLQRERLASHFIFQAFFPCITKMSSIRNIDGLIPYLLIYLVETMSNQT